MLKPIQSGYTPIGAKSLWDRTGNLCHTPVKIEPQTRPLLTPFVSMYLSPLFFHYRQHDVEQTTRQS